MRTGIGAEGVPSTSPSVVTDSTMFRVGALGEKDIEHGPKGMSYPFKKSRFGWSHMVISEAPKCTDTA